MERFNKKLILITILTCIFILSGCSNIRLRTFDASDNESGSNITTDEDDNQPSIDDKGNADNTVDNTEDAEPTPSVNVSPTISNIKPNANTELLIFSINAESGEIEPVTVLIPEDKEITPELIVSKVVESMTDQSLSIGVESVTTEKDAVVVSFYSDQPPLSDVGGGIESAILDAIAQSLIDNLDEYSKVIYRVEGESYISDHFDLEFDEVYLDAN